MATSNEIGREFLVSNPQTFTPPPLFRLTSVIVRFWKENFGIFAQLTPLFSKVILASSSHLWPSFFLENVCLSSLYIFPKLVDVVIGYCLRCELEKLPPKPSPVWLFSSQSGHFLARSKSKSCSP